MRKVSIPAGPAYVPRLLMQLKKVARSCQSGLFRNVITTGKRKLLLSLRQALMMDMKGK